MKTSLDTVKLNTSVKIKSLKCTDSLRRRLLDLGLVEGAIITPVLLSPAGELIAYEVRGTIIAIRIEDTKNIYVA